MWMLRSCSSGYVAGTSTPYENRAGRRGYPEHDADPAAQYNGAAQARSLIGLIGELGLRQPVIAGYDIGSRIAQAIARDRPELVRALVIAPLLPGIGDRILSAQAQDEFWYQSFHRLSLCTELIDGRPEAVRAYLRHFWSHWSGPGFEPADDHLEHLVTGSRRRPRCCGRRTIRCFPRNGRTGFMSSSPPRG
jgi:pimeloyl-ACP methyl ester carboxylesterase